MSVKHPHAHTRGHFRRLLEALFAFGLSRADTDKRYKPELIAFHHHPRPAK